MFLPPLRGAEEYLCPRCRRLADENGGLLARVVRRAAVAFQVHREPAEMTFISALGVLNPTE